MAKKENDTVLDKKTKEQLKQDIMEEINTKHKDEICSAIVDDVKKSFDHEYKEALKSQISSEIMDDIKKDIAKEQKKINRAKSFKIFRLYIYILLLIAGACYMIYCLYKSDNIEILKTGGKTTSSVTTKETTTTELIKDLDWYIKEYGSLLDSIKVADFDLFKGNISMNTLAADSKLALAYRLLDKSTINVDGIINTISEEDIMNAYNKLFGSNEGYVATNFMADNLSYAYSTNNRAYIAISNNSEIDDIATNKIIDIKENNGEIIITTIVALIKDNNVYNVENLDEAVGPKADLSTYADSLTKVDYRFKKVNDSYYIDSIVKR